MMVKVILLNGWNGPDRFYRKSVTKKGPPVDIPHNVVFNGEGKSRLPSTAKIVSDDYVTPLVKPGVDTFSEFNQMTEHREMLDANDPDKAAMVAQSKAVEEADAYRLVQKAKFDAELAAEAASNEGMQQPVPTPRKGRRKGK